MRILCIADEEDPAYWDFFRKEKLENIDLILSCGDLKPSYLRFLVTMGHAPLLYVHGNHDEAYDRDPPEGCDNIEDRVVTVGGLRIAGLGGSVRYRDGGNQYTQSQMHHRVRRMAWKLRKGVDIVLTHAPVRDLGDLPDPAHVGFSAFRELIERYQPRYLLHGHVHKQYDARLQREQRLGQTTVVNVSGSYILEL